MIQIDSISATDLAKLAKCGTLISKKQNRIFSAEKHKAFKKPNARIERGNAVHEADVARYMNPHAVKKRRQYSYVFHFSVVVTIALISITYLYIG